MRCLPVLGQGCLSPGEDGAHSTAVTTGTRPSPSLPRAPREPGQPPEGRRADPGWDGSRHLELALLPFEGSSEQQLWPKGPFGVEAAALEEAGGRAGSFPLRIKLILPRHLPWGCGTGEEGVTQIQVTKLTF